MSLKNSLTNWFKLVKIAADNGAKKRTLFSEYIDAKNEISILESIEYHPNQYLENNLGTKWCKIKYCPEDWLGMIQEDASGTVTSRCVWFSNCKCGKLDCQIKPKNHKYLDAKKAYEDAKQEHINSIKRVFGLRVK